MGRWEPDAEGRIRATAMALFIERGYAQTTVADIAERAGLNRRTFFRYFADKPEVLFRGSERLQDAMVGAMAASPPGTTPMDAVHAALEATAVFFDPIRQMARQRQGVIASDPELHERELIKMAKLSEALSLALQARGVDALDAGLAAESGIALFRVTFKAWVESTHEQSFGEVLRELTGRWRSLAGRRDDNRPQAPPHGGGPPIDTPGRTP